MKTTKQMTTEEYTKTTGTKPVQVCGSETGSENTKKPHRYNEIVNNIRNKLAG